MIRTVLAGLLACILCPPLALGRDLCIQLDTDGTLLNLKAKPLRAKHTTSVSGYLVIVDLLAPNGVGVYMPVHGQGILSSQGVLVMGLVVPQTEMNGDGALFRTRFGESQHNIECNAGTNGKIDVLDVCTDKIRGASTQENDVPAHVVECQVVPEVS